MYKYKFQLDELGFKEIPLADYTEEQLKKSSYVEKYLTPAIKHSNCGWDHCVYHVLENKWGREEYVALYPEELNKNGRFYNVSGNSLGAILETIADGIYN